MISAWEVYWVMQLDSIGRMFFCATVAGAVGSLFATAFIPRLFDEDFVKPKSRKWFLGPPIFLLVFGGIGLTFLPSTKTAASMILIPAVANNETAHKEAGELYALAKKALAAAVGETDEEPK